MWRECLVPHRDVVLPVDSRRTYGLVGRRALGNGVQCAVVIGMDPYGSDITVARCDCIVEEVVEQVVEVWW